MHHRPGDCRVYSGDRCCALRSFHRLTFLLIQPFNLIFSNGAEGVTHIRECREVVHVTSIKAYGAAGEENTFDFLPLLMLCMCRFPQLAHFHLRFTRTRRTRMPRSASSSK